MKKGRLLHREISWLIADLGHKDRIVISDAGLPVPPEVRKIDLALACGLPQFISVLDVVLAEMECEHALLAEEIKQKNSSQLREIDDVLADDIPVDFVSHEKFKQEVGSCRAVIRSGECTPFSNIILTAGVTF